MSDLYDYTNNYNISVGDNDALIHQLQSQMTQLKIICVTWQAKIRAIPCGHDVGCSWGPSDDVLADIAAVDVTEIWEEPDSHQQILTDSDVSDIFDGDDDTLVDEDEETGESESGDEYILRDDMVLLDFGSVQSSKRVRS